MIQRIIKYTVPIVCDLHGGYQQNLQLLVPNFDICASITPRLPTTQEEEDAKVKDMNGGSGSTAGLTPFALAAQAGGGRNTTSRFDNKVNIFNLCEDYAYK